MLKRFITKGTVQVNTNESPLLLTPNLYFPLEIGANKYSLRQKDDHFMDHQVQKRQELHTCNNAVFFLPVLA